MKKTLALLALAAAAGAPAQTVSYTVEPTHTFVSFDVLHFGISTIRGRFDRKEGAVRIDRAAKTGRVEVGIDLTSVNTGVEPFNRRLQGRDFFNAAETPKATFVGDRFTFAGDQVSEVGGQLTLNGRTQPVTLKASRFNCYPNPIFKREVCGGDFETTLQRSQFGLAYGLPRIAPDAVKVLIQIEAVRQQ